MLINQALHTLDLVQWFCGEPTEVVASRSNLTLREVVEVEEKAVEKEEKKQPEVAEETVETPVEETVEETTVEEAPVENTEE